MTLILFPFEAARIKWGTWLWIASEDQAISEMFSCMNYTGRTHRTSILGQKELHQLYDTHRIHQKKKPLCPIPSWSVVRIEQSWRLPEDSPKSCSSNPVPRTAWMSLVAVFQPHRTPQCLGVDSTNLFGYLLCGSGLSWIHTCFTGMRFEFGGVSSARFYASLG